MFAQQTVNSLPSCLPALRKCVAFTLAELLITLGIIGVVAALTIPSLINSYKKQVTVNGLKAAYSIFSQAFERSVQENGPIVDWDTSVPDMGERYINPYINVIGKIKVKDYGTMKTLYRYEKGTFEHWLFWVNGNSKEGIWSLKNGMAYTMVFDKNHKVIYITIDINGSKGPNQLGKDGFVFKPNTNTNKLEPFRYSYEAKTRTAYLGGCTYEGHWQYYDGNTCAALIMHDGWKIAPDYPW